MKFNEIIKEICKEEDIKVEIMSNNYLIKLTKNNVTKFIWGCKFPLNDHSIGSIIDDKYALYEICKNNNISVIEHKIIWNPSNKLGENTSKLLKEYFFKYNENVVLKPNNGSKGIDVNHLTNLNDLINISNKLFSKYFSLSICPYYDIKNEYRVVILDNEVKLVYEKDKLVVKGDGKDSVKNLLIKGNPIYFQNKNLTKYDYVLNDGKIFEYDWRFNLSRGATAKLISDKELEDKITSLALDVTKILGARFVSVDIINSNGKLLVMEVNSGVCIDKVCNFIDKDLKQVKEIYRSAIKKMFAIL